MQRITLAIALALTTLAGSALAGCPGGICPKPVRSAIAASPVLAPRRPHTSALKPSREHSIVVRRGHARGPGLFARIRFAPQARWR